MRKTVRKTIDQKETQKVVLNVLKYRVNILLPIAHNPQPIRAMNAYFTYSTMHYNEYATEVNKARKTLA